MGTNIEQEKTICFLQFIEDNSDLKKIVCRFICRVLTKIKILASHVRFQPDVRLSTQKRQNKQE